MRTSVRHSSLFVIGALLACAVVAVSSAGADSRSDHSAEGKIAFSFYSYRGTVPIGSDIYTLRVGGKGQRQLTTSPLFDAHPAWSPDGRTIVFSRGARMGRSRGIYAMDADGGRQRRLSVLGSTPSWSPDGTRIAFSKDGAIHVMNADGSGKHRVARNGLVAAWSPDGEWIAFAGIEVIRPDGSGRHRLTRDGYFSAWSPDGKKIAFVGTKGGRGNHTNPVWVMNADGSGPRRLGPFSWGDCNVAWSPNGRRIAFSNPDGLFAMNADGSGVVKLRGGLDACGLSWR
jgi:Tol biopolymer transport system component